METLIILSLFAIVIGIVIWRGIVGAKQIKDGVDLSKYLCDDCHCGGKHNH